MVIYPGSFDPFTLGHLDITGRAAKLFDRVLIAVANNAKKNALLTQDERISSIKAATQHLNNVEVVGIDGLLVTFAKQHGASAIIRGLRTSDDFSFESQLAGMNRAIDGSVETIFFSAQGKYTHISSSLVKEVAELKHDITPFVPPAVAKAMNKK